MGKAFKADGETFDPALDSGRLGRQQAAVLELMRDGRWRTIQEIHEAVGGSETGVSARVRDLRKERNGGFVVQRERVGKTGLWKYRAAIHPDWDERQRKIIRKAVAKRGVKVVAKKLGVSSFALRTFLED